MGRASLWVDDERPAPAGWLRAYTSNEAIRILSESRNVARVSLDHDLTSNDTGYEVAQWIEERAFNGDWDHVPRVILCHSQNPAGKARIEAAVASIHAMRLAAEARTKEGGK